MIVPHWPRVSGSRHRRYMPTFEDLRAFQHAMDLMVEVYRATASFPKNELYGLTSQLRRAACSVVSNIAEGQGRLTLGERRQMMSHARGSLFEVQAQIIAATRLAIIDAATANGIRNRAASAAREIDGLIKWIRKVEVAANRRPGEKSRTPDA